MSGIKRPAGKDFDPPTVQPKQLRVEPPLSQQMVAGSQQQFVLPVRHPLDTSRRLSQGTRIIGIPGILPNVSRQPSTFGFPSPLSPLGIPVCSPLSTGGLVGITPNPLTCVSHIRSPHPPHITIPTFPPVGITQHSQTRPTGMVNLEAPYIPSDTSLTLIRPGATPTSVSLTPRPLLAASPMAPPPPYPIGHLASVGGPNVEEFTCASPSQFLHSPTSLTAVTSQSSSATESTRSSPIEPPGKSRDDLPKGNQVTTPRVIAGHTGIKTKLIKNRKSRLAALKLRYEVQLKEKFFLEEGGNMMDFIQWKRRPNILREQYLKQYGIDTDNTSLTDQLSPKDILSLSSTAGVMKVTSLNVGKFDTEQPLPEPSSSTPSLSVVSPEVSTQKQPHKSSKPSGRISGGDGHSKQDNVSSTRIQIPLSTVSPSFQVISPLQQQPHTSTALPLASTPKGLAVTPSSPLKMLQVSSPSPRPATRAQLQTQVSFSSVYETSHEDIVMRARHEAEVMRAIADLRKEGLWSTSRLPKVQEPTRRRALWDFLLEEMQWLATDFANERRWKVNAAKKVFLTNIVSLTSVIFRIPEFNS